jgi:tetratricopeptide (TPR) repeat protein
MYKRIFYLAMFVMFFFAIIVSSVSHEAGLRRVVKRNYTGIRTLNWLIEGIYSDGGLSTSDDCRIDWFEGLLAKSINNNKKMESSWRQAMDCSQDFISVVFAAIPDNQVLAKYAHEQYPEIALPWFWLGDLEPENRMEYYRKGLELDASDGQRWIELGDMLKDTSPEDAMAAYLQACYHGDPGYHGCFNAGRIAEEMGNNKIAIEYYQLSTWAGVRQLANPLIEKPDNESGP